MGANKLQLETERVTIRDSEFSFNTGSYTKALQCVKRGRLIDLSRSRPR